MLFIVEKLILGKKGRIWYYIEHSHLKQKLPICKTNANNMVLQTREHIIKMVLLYRDTDTQDTQYF